MTENEAKIRRAVSVVQAAFPSGGGDWSRKRFEAWVAAVDDLDGSAVEDGAYRLVRDWSDDRGRIPYPGHLREYATATAKARAVRVKPTAWEPTPAWFARLVLAGICIRNGVTPSERTRPYMVILREFGLDREPAWGADDHTSSAVFVAARDHAAVAQEMGEANPAMLEEVAVGQPVDDERG